MIYFTSDTHFDHEGIIPCCARPFADVDQMNSALIDRINEKVGVEDTLCFLGDFSYGKVEQYLDRIKCRNIEFILGNHDVERDVARKLARVRHVKVHNYLELEVMGAPLIVLSHYPFFPLGWNQAHRGSWNLFGHVHGAFDGHRGADYRSVPEWSLQLDVGVDSHNFYPWSLEEVFEHMQPKFPAFIERIQPMLNQPNKLLRDGIDGTT